MCMFFNGQQNYLLWANKTTIILDIFKTNKSKKAYKNDS
jgi:hypothetical protein